MTQPYVSFALHSAVKMESDLFNLQSSFQPSAQSGSTGLPAATAWAGRRLPSPASVLCFWSNVLHALLLLFCDSDAHLLLSTLFFFLLSACVDPFTSAEAGDESMPNLNPFLSKLVVDAAHLPVVSSDGISFSSRTSGHEMFCGNGSFCFSSKVFSLISL